MAWHVDGVDTTYRERFIVGHIKQKRQEGQANRRNGYNQKVLDTTGERDWAEPMAFIFGEHLRQFDLHHERRGSPAPADSPSDQDQWLLGKRQNPAQADLPRLTKI